MITRTLSDYSDYLIVPDPSTLLNSCCYNKGFIDKLHNKFWHKYTQAGIIIIVIWQLFSNSILNK